MKAVAAFQADHGHPPAALGDLVPTYLPRVPSTGIATAPTYHYVAGAGAKDYDQNPWVLRAVPPCNPMGFDQLLYFPLQNYPKLGYGGSLERFGGWAYVHE